MPTALRARGRRGSSNYLNEATGWKVGRGYRRPDRYGQKACRLLLDAGACLPESKTFAKINEEVCPKTGHRGVMSCECILQCGRA